MSCYRPLRDETQWTSRRDALVRCVAAFLYGPSSINQQQEREIVLIHDEDYSRIEMRVQPHIVPTERAILSLWREAAANPGRSIDTDNGVSCRMVLDASTADKAPASSIPTNMENKRQVLEYLQQHCSIDFLREHRLNSSVDVILRKTNKKALMDVYREWNSEQNASSNNAISKHERLSSIFQQLLKPLDTSIDKVVACILHESGDSELACFSVHPDDTPNLQVCMFLGAVRDMHPWENRLLKECCSEAHIPCLRVRLGPVSEFTSKILTVVAFHHAKNTLGPALLQLSHHQQQQGDKKTATTTTDSTNVSVKQETQRLHVVCFMPIDSTRLASDLNNRSRAVWALVRVTVCTLWRSRLASSMETSDVASNPLMNGLTIVFKDGVTVSFEQDELVACLAKKHQAAPSEHQILQELCEKRDESVSNEIEWTSARADQLLRNIIPNDESQSFVLDSNCRSSTETRSLVETLYSSETNATCTSGGQILLLLRIRGDETEEVTRHEIVDSLKEACDKRGLPVLTESLIHQTVEDEEAATVTMLQHFIYQGRLLSALTTMCGGRKNESQKETKKRRRKKDKKARKKGHKKKKRKKDTK